MARTSKLEQTSSAKNLLLEEGYDIIPPDSLRCTMCGTIKKQGKTKASPTDSFYRTFNRLNKYTGVLSICKHCIGQIYMQYCIETNDNKKLSMFRLCQEVNAYWSETIWEMAFESKNDPYKTYFQKVNSLTQYQGLTFKDSDDYVGEITEQIYDDTISQVDLSKKAKKSLIEQWGEGLEVAQYNFLDTEFTRLTSNFECNDYGMELILRDIAWINWDIYQAKRSGRDIIKLIDARSKLMNDGNLKPVQSTGANSSDQQIAYGVLIRKFENEKPIPAPDKEWEDVDNIRKYIRIWFLGHLCAIMGLKNQYSEEYETELKRYTVELEENDLDDEEDGDD